MLKSRLISNCRQEWKPKMQRRKTKLSCNSAYGKNANNNCAQLESAVKKHDRYLIELEKHKKLAKSLHRKNTTEEEKEKKERGFSTYVNGANALPRPQSSMKYQDYSKTKKFIPKTNFTSTSLKTKKGEARIITPRRFWGQESVEIVTDTGAKLYASMRNMNCKYSDDFEDSIDFEKASNSTGDVQSSSHSRPKTVPPPQRKFWGQGPVMIKVSSGENLRASVSNMSKYSMNFDDPDDGNHYETDEEIPEELEVDLNSSNEYAEHFLVLGSSNSNKLNILSKEHNNT